MTEQDALDAAAKAVGYSTFAEARGRAHAPLLRAIRNHANEILARQASDKALADFRKEVSEKAEDAVEALHNLIALARPHFSDSTQMLALAEAGDASANLRRFIIPAPDPLVEALSEAMCGIPGEDYTQSAEDLRNVLAKHGLKLERIDQ